MLEIILHCGAPKDHKSDQNLTDFTISRCNLDRPVHCVWTGLAKPMVV